jgi:hypothetical protein
VTDTQAETPGSTGVTARAATFVPGRDRYLDLLRAVALVRILALHTFFEAVWLTVVFPSLGVMFALAGALMARSLDRPTLQVLRSRSRRLLLPLWIYSITMVGLLVLQGWRPVDGDAGGWWLRLVLWFVPVGDPPFPQVDASVSEYAPLAWGDGAADILWYIRAYFWFVLLSPFLLKAFKRLPWVTLGAPLLLTVLLTADLLPFPGEVISVVESFATYGSCWVLGFAYQRGFLQALPRIITPVVAVGVMAAGLLWAATHLPEDTGWDLGAIPLAQALWSIGFVVLLLRISPSWSTLPGPLRAFDGAITLVNNRAITIYLWHTPLLIATVPLIDRLWAYPVIADNVPWLLNSQGLQFAALLVMLGLAILVVGWVEDLAARRSLRLWPTGKRKPRPAREDADGGPGRAAGPGEGGSSGGHPGEFAGTAGDHS